MTAVTTRRTVRPDVDAILRDELRIGMLRHLRAAERAEAAYLAREKSIRAHYRDPIALRLAERDDTTLADRAQSIGMHRDWARTYAAVLQAEAAYAGSGPRPGGEPPGGAGGPGAGLS